MIILSAKMGEISEKTSPYIFTAYNILYILYVNSKKGI